MKKNFLIATLVAVAVVLNPLQASADNRAKNRQEVINRNHGFYKDILMDSGIGLTSRQELPASEALNLQMEYFEGPRKKATEEDKAFQVSVVAGNEDDTNGWLMYPDGAPRFRMLYVNGGNARVHATSLTKKGRDRICEYIKNGGSYVGTCAGAFFASAGGYSSKRNKTRNTKLYIGIWPGYTHSTGLSKSNTGMTITKRSSLLKYYDFGGDKFVDKVRHNGGCYVYDGDVKPSPKGTEVLALYHYNDTERVHIDGKPAIWAYKANAKSGRVVLCGSHPEGVKNGERLELMSSMVLYAMDGNPAPKTKGVLKSGQVREMNKRTEDADPEYTRIGDKQYHHFEVKVPRKCKQLKVKLAGYDGENGYDLTLCAKRGELAYKDNTSHKATSKGCDKEFTVNKPKAGKWYVSVLCETTVETEKGKNGTTYVGNKGVLNGVPYKVSVEY